MVVAVIGALGGLVMAAVMAATTYFLARVLAPGHGRPPGQPVAGSW